MNGILLKLAELGQIETCHILHRSNRHLDTGKNTTQLGWEIRLHYDADHESRAPAVRCIGQPRTLSITSGMPLFGVLLKFG